MLAEVFNGTNLFPTFVADRHHHQPISIGVSVLAQRYFCCNRRQPHLASDRLTKAYASMLTGLYLVFTFSVVVRMMAFRETLERYLSQVAEIRGDSLGSSVVGLVNASIWATVILATLATVVFIWHSYLTAGNGQASVDDVNEPTTNPQS